MCFKLKEIHCLIEEIMKYYLSVAQNFWGVFFALTFLDLKNYFKLYFHFRKHNLNIKNKQFFKLWKAFLSTSIRLKEKVDQK
jgi:hypothetical protein